VPAPREIIPLAAVLSNCVHLIIQIGLLMALVFLFGKTPNRHWVWLPLIWGLEVVFVCGLSFITSALNVYIRDMRYFVESANTVLFWLVPVVYSFAIIPHELQAHLSAQSHRCAGDGHARYSDRRHVPGGVLMLKLTGISLFMLASGLVVFRSLKPRFSDHL
jgi:lipopolysaccharide transport system permease protein